MLTIFSRGPPELPSFRWTTGWVLAGDSGCPWAGVGEGLASWDEAFFPDGSSSESDGGLLIPAMPPTGTRQAGSGSESIWGHPWSRSPVGAQCCWEGQLPVSRARERQPGATTGVHSQQGPGLTHAPPLQL